MKKMIFALAVSLLTQTALAKSITCEVKIDGNSIVSGRVELKPIQGQPEGSAAVTLYSEGNVRLYALTSPIQLVANELEMGIVVRAKRSNRLFTILDKLQTATVRTVMDGKTIEASCIDI